MEKLCFNKNNQYHQPLRYWTLDDGNIISIYQGNRGANPELDYIVKYLAPGKRLRAPSHTHWIVDLLMKAEANKQMVKSFIEEWHNMYDTIEPFKSDNERREFKPVYKHYMMGKYHMLSPYGEFGVEFLSVLIELFTKCEKQSPGAYMFKNMLGLVKDYCDGKKDFYQIISHSKRV
jgi:hypothetical protein